MWHEPTLLDFDYKLALTRGGVDTCWLKRCPQACKSPNLGLGDVGLILKYSLYYFSQIIDDLVNMRSQVMHHFLELIIHIF